MNIPNNKPDSFCQLISELRWTERHAEQSARIAVSMALWLGMTKDRTIEDILNIPSAGYLRANRHILFAAWAQISCEMTGEAIKVEHEPIFEIAA
jgi:hypothetical protein